MAGRDIGTVVLPDADLKIFLDASVEGAGPPTDGGTGASTPTRPRLGFILAQLRRRDDLDENRAVAPLRPAEDAVHIVTDGNQFEDTVAAVVAAIREGRGEGRGRRGDALMADVAKDAGEGTPAQRRSPRSTRKNCCGATSRR
jgi:cytidylate kinase